MAKAKKIQSITCSGFRCIATVGKVGGRCPKHEDRAEQEANGYVPATMIAQLGRKQPAGFSQPLRLVIYRSERDFGTYAAAKVTVPGQHPVSDAELLRLAAELEESGTPVHIDRDRVGNRMLWIESEDPVAGHLDSIAAAASNLGWM